MAQINWSKRADNELDRLIDFLAIQSETYAKIQVQKIYEQIDNIKTLPRLGRIVPELEYEKVRELINYRQI